jgi:hypothetical protein
VSDSPSAKGLAKLEECEKKVGFSKRRKSLESLSLDEERERRLRGKLKALRL